MLIVPGFSFSVIEGFHGPMGTTPATDPQLSEGILKYTMQSELKSACGK